MQIISYKNPIYTDGHLTAVVVDVFVDEVFTGKQSISTTWPEFADIKEPIAAPLGYEFKNGEIVASAELIMQQLAIAKQTAVALIEQKANEFHVMVVGTNDSRRAERFALNLELAQKLLAGTATTIEQQALQMQLEANQQAGHPFLKDKTLQQFAQWITQFKQYTTLGSALIESTLIKGRAAINAAQSVEEIEQIKVQLAQNAQAAFERLQAQLSG